jgi:hypothetical protein
MSLFNQSIELAAAGKWDDAWLVARSDDGLAEGVTREQWTAYAIKCIRNRASIDAANAAGDHQFND